MEVFGASVIGAVDNSGSGESSSDTVLDSSGKGPSTLSFSISHNYKWGVLGGVRIWSGLRTTREERGEMCGRGVFLWGKRENVLAYKGFTEEGCGGEIWAGCVQRLTAV